MAYDLMLDQFGDRYQLRQGHALLARLLNSCAVAKVPVQSGAVATVIRTRQGFYVIREGVLYPIELNADIAMR